MLNTYKNLLFSAVRDKFDLDDFWAQETETGLIVHVRGSDLMFEVAQSPYSYHQFRYRFKGFEPTAKVEWYSEDPILIDQTGYQHFHFDTVFPAYLSWLHDHVSEFFQEQGASNLWAELGNYETLFNMVPTDQINAPFTEAERELARIGIRRYRLLIIKNFNPTVEQLAEINYKLDYVAEAVTRLNQFDWKSLVISTVVGIGISLSVDTEKGRLLFRLLEQAMGNLLRLLH